MSEVQEEQKEVVYHDGVDGPEVTWELQNVQTGDWISIHGKFDQGSNVTNLPESYAERLGQDLKRDQKIGVETVGGPVNGFETQMVYQFAGKTFKGPVEFRPDSGTGPLMGFDPVKNNFNVYFDNVHSKVEFIPISGAMDASANYTNSVMHLKRMVAFAVARITGKGIPKEFLA